MDEETEKQLSAKIAADEIDKRISSLTTELDRSTKLLAKTIASLRFLLRVSWP